MQQFQREVKSVDVDSDAEARQNPLMSHPPPLRLARVYMYLIFNSREKLGNRRQYKPKTVNMHLCILSKTLSTASTSLC